MDTPKSHFPLLRLAILRGLSVEQVDAETFAVGSHSHPTHMHAVKPLTGVCCCPAFDWCSHLSIALDRWMTREADAQTAGAYLEAKRRDFGGLHRQELSTTDKRFMRAAVERVRTKYAPLFVTKEREQVTF